MKFLLWLAAAAGLCLLAACKPVAVPASPGPPVPNAPATATIPPGVQVILDEGLALIDTHSYYASQTDTDERRLIAYRIAAGWEDPVAARSALETVLRVMGDEHGYVLSPEAARALAQATTTDARPPRAELLAGRLGYLLVPEFASGLADQQVQYAIILETLIQEIDSSLPCGWVIDLRGNLGGSMWAMLPALGVFLGEDKLGAFVYTDGSTEAWAVMGGQATLNGEVMVSLPGPVVPLARPDSPVAVLIDGLTLSSGEAVLVSFLGRPDTRIFGQPTGGYTTAIEGFPLQDGSLLGISVAVLADRTGQIHPGPIQPDALVALPADGSIPGEAIDWLLGQPSCDAP